MSASRQLRVKRLREDAKVPSYATERAAGLDLSAALDGAMLVRSGARVVVPTGIALALPLGTEGQVRPRSGLALRHGITVLNAPGTIDEDYRGEISVLLVNLGEEDFVIQPGDRIAQLVVAPVIRAECQVVDDLDATPRGSSGFGSTGVGG